MLENITQEGIQLLNDLNDWLDGKEGAKEVTIENVLKSTDAGVILPQVLVGEMKEAAEPLHIVSKFFEKIRLTGSGNAMTWPYVGDMTAEDIPEGSEYPEKSIDLGILAARQEIRVGKVGLIVKVTDEAIKDSQWDVLGVLIRKAGQAMARFKEEKIFRAFFQYGHVVFDNDIRAAHPEAGTTGYSFDGTFNNTMSVEDFVDMILIGLTHDHMMTDVLMHPLTYLVFAKNEMIDRLPLAGFSSKGSNVTIKPDQVQSRIPFQLTLWLTPFIQLNPVTRKFCMYAVDRTDVGTILIKDDLGTDQFEDPRKDVKNIKVRERYGVGIKDQGKAIMVAKNIALAKSYEMPQRVHMIDNVDVPKTI